MRILGDRAGDTLRGRYENSAAILFSGTTVLAFPRIGNGNSGQGHITIVRLSIWSKKFKEASTQEYVTWLGQIEDQTSISTQIP